MPNTKEPTIVIRKPDGTKVRVPLSEARAMKIGSNLPESISATTTSTPTSHKSSSVSMVPPAFSPQPQKSMPIAEEIESAQKLEEGKIVKIESEKEKIKMIGSMEPTPKDVAMAKELAIRSEQKKDKGWDNDDHKSLLEEDLPMVIDHKKEALSTIAPVKDIFVNEALAMSNKKSLPKITRRVVSNKMDLPSMDRPLVNSISKKPVLHDVQPLKGVVDYRPAPKPTMTTSPGMGSMGPADELGSINLVDFRRLGGDVSIRIKNLLNKFMVLKDDSYIMYMRGVSAYRQSPLYHNYLNILLKSLKENKPIDASVPANSKEEDLSSEEVVALASMHAELAI